ncbi:hypothetical protein FisN_23Lh134 [Fistulifera solaris]|uniref:Uncharacterized protein n=1 Tax=Fistulifera solaris TaxID=1519565 RepID=A0A1Z5KMA6_FISSO|nr:hypothetical protein FisN_23Lh134 [Fistulifera solaris]|eukprot:GAX27297.1 hypothetical protein FisN_23Lh134 [Fistulifera solaris]
MDSQKSGLTLKDRLLQYQENARKQKEYEKKQQLSVSQLDRSMTDVSKYSRAESVTNRKATTVSADMVNRLDPNLLEDFNVSGNLNASMASMGLLQSPVKGYHSPMKGFRSPMKGFQSPPMSKLEMSSNQGSVGTRDESELRGLFVNALANYSSVEEMKQAEDDTKESFSDLRSRYLRSIFALIPDYGDVSDLSKERRLAIFRQDGHKREEYVNIRDAWDLYEQKARPPPHEQTAQDKEVETKIKATETDISVQWATLAEQVVDDILHGEGETTAEEGDDSLLACVESARTMAVENENRQRYKERTELKRQTLLLEDSMKEENSERLQQESASSFSLVIVPEDDTMENIDDNNRWAEEARNQRLAHREKVASDEVSKHDDLEEGSDQDDDIIDQAKRLRRAYIRHLANQKDSDSESEEDDDVDNITKWIAEARQLKQLSRSKLHLSFTGSNSSAAADSSNFDYENIDGSMAENDEGNSSRNLSRELVSDSSDSDDFDDSEDSDSVYLWREEARLMKERALASKGDLDEEVAVDAESYVVESSESSYYSDVLTKAMELENKYNQRKSSLHRDEDERTSSEDDVDRSFWLAEARKIKAKGRCDLDDPERQAWVDEAKRLREETMLGQDKRPEDSCCLSDNELDEEVALKALRLCRSDDATRESLRQRTRSQGEISMWVQKAGVNEAERRKKNSHEDVWLVEAKRIVAEAFAKNEAGDHGAEEGEADINDDVQIVKEAKQLRREYIREQLKFSSKSEADNDGFEMDDVSHWIQAARKRKQLLQTRKLHPMRASKKKWYEDSSSSESDDDDKMDGARRATFVEAAKRVDAESKSEVMGSVSAVKVNRAHDDSDFFKYVVQKAMALEKKYRQQRAERDESKVISLPEEPDPTVWILEARKRIDDSANMRRSNSKAKKKKSRKKKEKKSKDKKSRKDSKVSVHENASTLSDYKKEDAKSHEKDGGSSVPVSQWILEARERKEKALLALKAAKEEVRARQKKSREGLTLEEKKKLRVARLQEARERREAEAKRDLEEKRKEAEAIKLAQRQSKPLKKKAFYSDSSGSDKDSVGDKSESSNDSIGSAGHDKMASSAEPFDSSSSDSSSSEDSVDQQTRRVRKRPDASAYIVNTDPSSSETVCSDTSAEVARVKGKAAAKRGTTKKKAREKPQGTLEDHGLVSPRRLKKSSDTAKASTHKSPKKVSKIKIENTDETLNSPTKSKKKVEDMKSPSRKSPKKSKKAGEDKSPKSPKKSSKAEKAMKSPKKTKSNEVETQTKGADSSEIGSKSKKDHLKVRL